MKLLIGSLVMLLGLMGLVATANAQGMEFGRNRPGGDFTHFPLPIPDPNFCRAACAANGNCKSWTFVNPGVQGPLAQCWLKSSVPASVVDACCVSGVKAGAGGAQEANTDRPGGDFNSVNLPLGSNASACRNLCNADGTCKAWTFVKAGFQGANPRCWLKSSVPPKVANNCCTSGVK